MSQLSKGLSMDAYVNHLNFTCIPSCSHCVTAALVPSHDQSVTPAKKAIPLLSCWSLDIRKPKWPGSSCRLPCSGNFAVAPGKSVSFFRIRTSNTTEPSIVSTEAQSLTATVVRYKWHDLVLEPQGPSMGLPQTS